MIKTFSRVGTYLNKIKAKYEKPTTSVILNGQNLQAFPVRLGTKQGCSFSSHIFRIVLEILATATRQEEEIKASKLERN